MRSDRCSESGFRGFRNSLHQTAFANVTDFWITSEFTNGVVETTGLDNVSLQSVDTSILEPGLGIVAGLIGLAVGWKARK
ncbi:MAG: hypothetical protein HY820_23205 [Acidobacteria bacterium]|nr:hypothetical protein [Acidobacteriota bacterium]